MLRVFVTRGGLLAHRAAIRDVVRDVPASAALHMLNAILVERGIARARSYPAHDALDLLFSSLQG